MSYGDELIASKQNPHLPETNVRFFWHYKEDKEASEKEGRPIHKEVEMVEFRVNRDLKVRPVEERDKIQYPHKYAAFQAENNDGPAFGTLLKEWPIITRTLVLDFAHFGLKTIEQLAALDKDKLRSMPPVISQWHDKAVDWIKAGKSKQVTVTNLRKKLKTAETEIERLNDLVWKLNQRIEAVEGIRAA